MDLAGLLADLRAEHADLDALVADLDEDGWLLATPAEGWTVKDSISHLAYYDGTARLAVTDADEFVRSTAERLERGELDADVALGRAMWGEELLDLWRARRANLLDALVTADPTTRVPWYGPPMGLASFITARLMETWAHGQDVVDALGATPIETDRLRHVIHIGIGARPYAFQVNNRDDPGAAVRVVATAPNGDTWAWGPDDASDRVEGTALDVALVLTRRRHPDDTDITVTGPTAASWIEIAQSFAGPPGPVRPPSGSARSPRQ